MEQCNARSGWDDDSVVPKIVRPSEADCHVFGYQTVKRSNLALASSVNSLVLDLKKGHDSETAFEVGLSLMKGIMCDVCPMDL